MLENERKKGSSQKILIGSLLIVLIILATNFARIQNSYSKITSYKSKRVSTVTRELNLSDLINIEYEQIQLAKKFDKGRTVWIHEELQFGAKSLLEHQSYLSHHPEYDLAKLQFSLVEYKIDGKKVLFLSNPKMIEVHSKSGWKNK